MLSLTYKGARGPETLTSQARDEAGEALVAIQEVAKLIELEVWLERNVEGRSREASILSLFYLESS